jgi:hypothetical protein
MVTKLRTLLAKPEVQTQCRHHWIIETASGPTSPGICKICGIEKHFDNVLEETTIDKYDASAYAGLSAKKIINNREDTAKSNSAKNKSALSLNNTIGCVRH